MKNASVSYIRIDRYESHNVKIRKNVVIIFLTCQIGILLKDVVVEGEVMKRSLDEQLIFPQRLVNDTSSKATICHWIARFKPGDMSLVHEEHR